MEHTDQQCGWMWATFTVRWVLGLIFLMAGWWKTFELTPMEHAAGFFIERYGDTWIPTWMLWATGTTIPVLELLAGLLVCLGFLRNAAYIILAAILVIVTYGHLLLEPLYDTTGHIFPRLVLLVFLFIAPRQFDVLSLDHLIARWRGKGKEGAGM